MAYRSLTFLISEKEDGRSEIKLMKNILTILITILLWCNVAFAGLSVDSYLKAREGKNKEINKFIDENIMGIGTGIFWSNVSINSKPGKNNNEKPMFCSPPKMSLTNENYINFLDQEIEDQKNIGTLTGKEEIGMMIIMHMRRIFPCE